MPACRVSAVVWRLLWVGNRIISRLNQVDSPFAQFLASITGLIIANQPGRSWRFRIPWQFAKQSNLILFFPAPEADRDRWVYAMLLRNLNVLGFRFLLYTMGNSYILSSCAVQSAPLLPSVRTSNRCKSHRLHVRIHRSLWGWPNRYIPFPLLCSSPASLSGRYPTALAIRIAVHHTSALVFTALLDEPAHFQFLFPGIIFEEPCQ